MIEEFYCESYGGFCYNDFKCDECDYGGLCVFCKNSKDNVCLITNKSTQDNIIKKCKKFNEINEINQ